MNRITPLLLLLCLLLYGVNNPLAAQDNPDSSSMANDAAKLMEKAMMQQITDSLKQDLLLQQLENISHKEANKRKELEIQLQQIREADSIKRENLRQEIDRKKSSTAGYPVVLGNDTIYYIYLPFGSFSAKDRAETNSRKIETLARSFSKNDSLRIINTDNTTQAVYGEEALFSVTEADALWKGVPREQLATQYARQIKEQILIYQESRSLTTLLTQIGLTLLVLTLSTGLIILVNMIFRRWIDGYLIKNKERWFSGMAIKGYEFLNADKQLSSVLFVTKIIRYGVNLIQLYITIPLLFYIFPVTEHIADLLLGWILSPVKKIFNGVYNYFPDLFSIAVICIVMFYVVRFVRYIMNEIKEERLVIKGFYPDWAEATYNILRVLLYAFTFVMIFPYLPGSGSKIFQGVSVFIGVVFSLGSSSAISNAVAGLVITYMRPFKVGDHIKIGDQIGDVLEKTPFVTRILTHKQEIITIPNSTILSSTVVNYTTTAKQQGVIFHTTITIGYDVPWRKVHAMMIEAALRVEWVLKTPAPFVLQTSLDDFYVSYQLCAYTQNPEKQASINSALHQNIQDVFNENSVEIMSPHYRNLRDGNQTSIPSDYLPSDYQSPVFNIKNHS